MCTSRGSSQPRNRTRVSHTAGGFFTSWATREDPCILLSKTYPSFKTQLSSTPFLKLSLLSPACSHLFYRTARLQASSGPVIYTSQGPPDSLHHFCASIQSLQGDLPFTKDLTSEFSLSSTVTEVCSQQAGGNKKYRKSRDLARLVSDSSLADCETSGKEWSLPSLDSTSVKRGWGW